MLDKIDSQVGNVNAHPLPAQTLRSDNRRAAATERVKNRITRGATVYDAPSLWAGSMGRFQPLWPIAG